MKKLALVLVFALITFTSKAQESEGATITVVVENVLSNQGTILAGLHTSETFMKAEGVSDAFVPAAAGEVKFTFENVAPGTFALLILHDANDNLQMDMEPNGMPKESYGTSGTMNMYGPPTFESAKFEVTKEDQEIRIRM